MLANVNPYSGALPINPFAREIAAVCDKHAVAHGSPGKLAGFLQALHRNKHLAMDFWSLVVRFSEDENTGSVDPDWLLAVIVEGVTGWNVAKLCAADAPDVRHVNELASILAGEDVVPSPPDPDPLIQRDPVIAQNENRRLVLEPEPAVTADTALRPLADDKPTAFRMAGYADTTSGTTLSHAAVLALLLILPTIAGLLFLNHRNPSAWKKLSTSLYTSSKSHPAPPPTPAAHLSAASPFAVPDPNIPVEDATAAPPSTSTALAPTQTPVPRTPSQPAPSNLPTVATTPADISALPSVPEQTMRSHLISSRVPIYPFTAELPGPVVIKVIITTRGTVRPIEVIAGDPTLRRAALDAVTTWHYDPWLVDGTPTDVTTTVTVDPPTDRP